MTRFIRFAVTAFAVVLASSATAGSTRETVTTAIAEVLINKNVGAIPDHFTEPYIRHNQSVATGLVAFQDLAAAVIADNPGFSYRLVRLIVDGDIAIAHGIYTEFADVALVGFDIFRVENGKTVEHWDNLSPVAANNPSGHSQTDGATEVTDIDQTDANKAPVAGFYDNVLINGNFDRLGQYFYGGNYIQHNSDIADSLNGLAAGLQALADAGITMRITTRHALYGE